MTLRFFALLAAFAVFMLAGPVAVRAAEQAAEQPAEQAAKPTFLQKWLPALFPPETGPKPEDTLEAPFRDVKPTKSVKGLEWRGGKQEEAPSDQVFTALNIPHRAARDIGEWTVTHVSDVMSFGRGDYQTKLSRNKQYFDSSGYEEYRRFLQNNNLLKVLDSGQFRMRSFVKESPLLLNEGPVRGRYRWLYEIPVMITYMKPEMKNYENSEPVSQVLTLRVQVGRVPTSEGNQDGLLLESWDGKLKKLEKMDEQ